MSLGRLALAGLALFAAASCSGGTESSCGPSKALVTGVTDGDTVTLSTGEKVRYLLVNTSEITKGKAECYGQEAADFNSTLVLNKEVALSYDEQCTDRFGRLLAYVSVNGREVNSLLVERGYACVEYIPPDGTARKDEFYALQSAAKAAKQGIWGACSPVPCAD